MLPEAVWRLSPLGTFNLHASLLPQYRGAAPINRAIMNGEKMTGVTTFFLEHAIDTGNILFRREVPIGPDETAGELHDKLMIAGAGLVTRTIDSIASGNLKPVSQSELVRTGKVLHEAPKIFRDDCRIDWNQAGQKIHDHIRGLSPYPGAWTVLSADGTAPFELKIFKSRFFPGENDSAATFPKISLPGGILQIEEMQAPGKRKMTVAEFLNGFQGKNITLH
jgi:methionyl-tRNA formyltransferase